MRQQKSDPRTDHTAAERGSAPAASDTPPTSSALTRRAALTRPVALTRRAALAGVATGGLLTAGALAAAAQERPLKQVASGTTPEPAPAQSPAPTLDTMLTEAAATHDIPVEVLSAIGWTETRLDGRAGEPTAANGFGIMNLVDNPSNQSLLIASQLTGLSTEQLRVSDQANLLGGAAVLRSHADQLGLSAAERAVPAAWLPAVGAFSGSRDQDLRAAYANSVADAVSTEVQVAAVSGRRLKGIPTDARLGRVIETAPPPPPPGGVGATAPEANPQPIGDVMPAVSQYPAYSGNYRSASRPADYPINYVIIHITQGSWSGALSWFQSSAARVSAHYTIRSSDGRIGQSVREADVAWHAGNSSYNNTSIGIEHEGFITQSSWFTDAMYRSSAALVRSICDRYGIPKTRSRILGHNEVPGATHTDPGPYWDWAKYMSYVNTPSVTPTWQLVLDNNSPEFSASANWRYSDYNQAKLGPDYRFADPEPVTDTAWYSANLPADGQYVIECRYPADAGYNDLTPYVVVTPSGNQVVYVNQRSRGGQWRSLGTYTLPRGQRQVVGVSRWARGSGYVIADAIRISRVG